MNEAERPAGREPAPLGQSERTQIRERAERCADETYPTLRSLAGDVLALDAALTEAEALAESRLEDIFYQLGQVVAYTERAEAAERERDEAFGKIDRLNDEANDLGHDCERAEARSAALEEGLRRATYIARNLHEMIDQETWRATGGDDMQGHYEGDYHAANLHDEIKNLAALAPAPAEETRVGWCAECGWIDAHDPDCSLAPAEETTYPIRPVEKRGGYQPTAHGPAPTKPPPKPAPAEETR